MEPENLHAPGTGEEKHSTQIISLFVGAVLFILGLCGILFSGFAGLHLSAAYSTIIAVSGVILFYNGYKNNSRDAFLSCLIFAIFFGIHALAGWVLGSPGVPRVGFDNPDPAWLTIIPNFHELGRNDHILNTILAFVLTGGAIDWFRRNSEKGHRKEVFRDIKEDYRSRKQHTNTNRPIQH
jgi:hypothetical protein